MAQHKVYMEIPSWLFHHGTQYVSWDGVVVHCQ